MSTMQPPLPGGHGATALSVAVLLTGALLAVVVHWALLLASVAGLGILRYRLAAAQQAAKVASRLVVPIDGAESQESGGTSSRRRRGTLDTIADDSLEEGQSPSPQPASSKSERSSNDREKQLGIPNFERVAHGRARKRPPDGCHRILGDLDTPPSSLHPSARSERSVSSQRIIEDLQAQIQALKDSRSNPPSNPTSARSDRSVRSDTSQRIIDGLKAQIANLMEQKAPLSARSDRSAKSGRSDSSQRIITDLEAQIKELKDEVKNVRRIAASPGNAGELKSFLRSLQLPEEYDKILADDGIEFLEDVVEYTEAELVELGFKRAHAKRLLKAAAAKDAPAAEG